MTEGTLNHSPLLNQHQNNSEAKGNLLLRLSLLRGLEIHQMNRVAPSEKVTVHP